MKSLTTCLLTVLLWSQSAFAMTGQGNKVDIKVAAAKIYIKAVATGYTNAFHQSIENYNGHRTNPEKLLSVLDDKNDIAFFKHLLKGEKSDTLPPIEKRGATYFIQFPEGTLSFDIINTFEGEIYFNNKKYTFNRKLSLSTQAEDFANFINKNALKKTSYLNFLIPEAEAFICGGFCIGALVAGTVALGYGVYKYAMKTIGGSDEARKYSKIKEEVSKMSRECNQDLQQIQEFNGTSSSYSKATPGAFSSFSIIKGVIDQQKDVDRENLTAFIYKKLGAKDLDSCQKLSKKIETTMSKIEYRNAIIEGRDIAGEVCKEHDSLLDCLETTHEIHLSHRGKRNIYDYRYDSDLGVYEKGNAYSTSK